MRRVGRATTLLIAALLPVSACAVWGPFGGLARLESAKAPAGLFDGYEAGVVAFGPNGEGFWQAAFTRLDEVGGPGRITRAGARLNFTVLGGSAGLFYAGAGAGRNWIASPAGDHKHWSFGVQAGMLIAPADIARRLAGRKPGVTRPAVRIGVADESLLLGAEAGWTRGPAPLEGFEFRGFVTLLY